MSVSQAFAFIQQLRRDAALRGRVAALGPDATLQAAAALAEGAGFRFGGDELRRAHRHDWALRSLCAAQAADGAVPRPPEPATRASSSRASAK